MKKKNLLFILITLTISCNNINTPIKYVNTFIGTGGHGHTYPGVSLPFGMMQLSPDTRLEGWDGCGGYHYTDSIIYGFSHTHLSGTGISDYGDVLLMPTSGEVNLSNGVIESKNSNKQINELGYSSKFSHNNEKSEPGYYQVFLEDYDINVELTTSLRSGIHKYSYSKKDNANLILDLKHRDKLLKHNINIIDSMTISGFRYSDEWAREQRVYFLIKLSHPFINYTLNNEKNILGLTFGKLKKPLVTKVSISAVDSLGAIENFNEIVNLDFNQTKKNAQAIWNNQLNKIQIKTKSKEKKEIFYTALYHSFLAPNTYNDINGNYNGMDLKKHNSPDNHYTVFSLWDTFRASHPLFTILETKKTNEFIRTLLRQFQDGGKLPIWELAGNYTDCMIGYHAIPVIVDAYIKGIRDYDTDMALNAMVLSAESNTHGLKAYKKNGFIRASDEPESVSKNLEYAYDDWCIAVMADSLGKKEIAKRFYKRAQYYKNLYDPETGFFRGKNSYSWFGPFKPEEVNFNYTEANAWQYSLFVPQDISGHIKLKGGELSYEKHLDAMFESSSVTSGRHQPDVTGLIGQYAHGNEPSHHMAYLYNFIGKPSKTQKYTAQIMNEQYSNLPDGLSGNEDCGQMSAWYVLSSLGFYPVTPGLDYYTIGTPLFDAATINLENGNTFKIRTKNLNSDNIYIQSATLNGKEFNNSFLKHSTITNGGELLFNMGENPSSWGEENRPYSIITSNKIVAVPFFISKSQTFVKDHYIELGTVDSSQIFFSIKGRDFKKYLSPIVISNNTEITIYAKKGKIESKRVTAKYFKIDNSKSIQISSKYANQYAAAGDKTLIDQLRGGVNYRTGNWQGYRENLEVVIDLNKIQKIKSISLGCHQDIRSWIFYPKNVEYWSSLDGENYDYLGKINTETPENIEGSFHKDIQLEINGIKTRYVKIKAKNYGICPEWHLGAGGKTWIFVDEIIIK
tara:strand:+ start:3387 stop:6275 length:2889 start_codon:yes stop_codon:yes gene_type:complete